MTDEELAEQISNLVGTVPTGEEKQNVFSFLFNVARAEDTTKLGNLTKEEVGDPKHPQRTYKELALFCSNIADMAYFADYFLAKSEIMTSTSLSKDAKLINLAIMTKKQIEDVTSKENVKENRGWFKRKSKPVGQTE